MGVRSRSRRIIALGEMCFAVPKSLHTRVGVIVSPFPESSSPL